MQQVVDEDILQGFEMMGYDVLIMFDENDLSLRLMWESPLPILQESN